MVDATRLANLLGNATTIGAPWTTDYSALTEISGNMAQIPWRTKAEWEAAAGLVTDASQQSGRHHATPTGNEPTDVSATDSTEGDDISLQSESTTGTFDPTTKMVLTMVIYPYDKRTQLLQGGVASYSVNVGDTLKVFDADRKAHGTAFAFKQLLARPCEAFRFSVDTVFGEIMNRVVTPVDVEAKLSALPGVKA